jgi:pimeloyl-ACP methyl ester carboxylesterase
LTIYAFERRPPPVSSTPSLHNAVLVLGQLVRRRRRRAARRGFAVNVFLRDGENVYRTWHTDGRGTEQLTYTFALIDTLPWGRQEEWQDSPDGWPQSPTYSNWPDSPDVARLYGPNGDAAVRGARSDAAALLRALEAERADVMGYSQGGGVALQLALRHPMLVDHLVVLSAAYRRDGWYASALQSIEGLSAAAFAGTPVEQAFKEHTPDAAAFEATSKR